MADGLTDWWEFEKREFRDIYLAVEYDFKISLLSTILTSLITTVSSQTPKDFTNPNTANSNYFT